MTPARKIYKGLRSDANAAHHAKLVSVNDRQLTPADWADLARSKLTEADAKLMQLFHDAERPEGYVIPYLHPLTGRIFTFTDKAGAIHPYWRKKLTGPRTGFAAQTEGRLPKYDAPRDTPPRLYFPPNMDWKKLLPDHSIDITLTEGEKKGYAACKVGVPCVALSGVWCFRSSTHGIDLLPDFELLKKHRLIICFDSNVTTNEDVAEAERALIRKLIGTGVRVAFARIPQLNDKENK